MAYEEIRAAIDLLMDEVDRHPEDQRIVHDQLREKLATLRSLGLSVPEDLIRLEQRLAAEDPAPEVPSRLEQQLAAEDEDESSDLFDNLPV
jgi:hypothetical protein